MKKINRPDGRILTVEFLILRHHFHGTLSVSSAISCVIARSKFQNPFRFSASLMPSV